MAKVNRLGQSEKKISYRVCLDCGVQVPYDLTQGIGREITTEERFKFLECDSAEETKIKIKEQEA